MIRGIFVLLFFVMIGCQDDNRDEQKNGSNDVGEHHTNDSDASVPDEPGASAGEPVNPATPVQPAESGPAECTVDLDCEEADRVLLSELSQPAAPPGSILGSHCGYVGIVDRGDGLGVAGPTCECEIEGLGTRILGPVGVGCYETGRGGDCLFDDADFEGCDQDDANSCQASCALLHERLTADAERMFAGEIVTATCDNGSCRRIVRIEDQCFPSGSYRYGQGYDCALGVDGVFAAHEAASRSPEETLDFFDTSRYPLGTDGMVKLEFVRSPEKVDGAWFGASAQFYATVNEPIGYYGEIVDPLDGLDDCSITRRSSLQTTSFPIFLRVDSLVLIDGDREFPLREGTSASPWDGYVAYSANLTELKVTPRFGGAYGLRGEGGSFGTRFEIEEIRFPEALLSSLDDAIRFDPQALTLRWQGSSTEPLSVLFSLRDQLSHGDIVVEIECELEDDGEHTFDPAVFEPIEANFASVYLTRRARQQYSVGDKTLAVRAQVSSEYDVAWGPSCDGSDAVSACQAAADRILAIYAECGRDYVPTREELCPPLLQEACGTCTEYFECLAEQYACGPGGLVQNYGSCSCE
ncbi:MAG: hypothetical protein JXA30_11290 [Deltaproteobacteria bacterium]|nr:hypothetical protein [Deltaproteobacteria bacterium]